MATIKCAKPGPIPCNQALPVRCGVRTKDKYKKDRFEKTHRCTLSFDSPTAKMFFQIQFALVLQVLVLLTRASSVGRNRCAETTTPLQGTFVGNCLEDVEEVRAPLHIPTFVC